MDGRNEKFFPTKPGGFPDEFALPGFPDDDTVTTTFTKSRRVSFGTNFIKEFVVGSAATAQCVTEYERAFSSSDSSNANSSHSALESGIHDKDFSSLEPERKIPKISSTICFNTDSPTTDMEFTEGCISLAKSILDKRNKEMKVIIQGSKKGDEKVVKVEETKIFEGSQFDMSLTRCFKSKNEERRFDGNKTKIFSRSDGDISMTRCSRIFEAQQDESRLGCSNQENQIPLDLIIKHLDKDDSSFENSLFNPEKSLNDALNCKFDVSTKPGQLNNSMEEFTNVDIEKENELLNSKGEISLTGLIEVEGSIEENNLPQQDTSIEKHQLETTNFSVNEMAVESLERQSTPLQNTSSEKSLLETTNFVVNEMVVESLEKQSTPQRNFSPEKPLLETTNFSVNEMVMESLKEQTPEKPQLETTKIMVNSMVLESHEEQLTPQRNTPVEKSQLEETNFLGNEMVVKTLEKQSSPQRNTSPEKCQLEATKNVANGAVAESLEEQSILQGNTPLEKSQLEATNFSVNEMVVESVKEQSPKKPRLETTEILGKEVVAESLEEQYTPQQNTSPEKCQLETNNFSVNEMVVESLKEQSPEKPQLETTKILEKKVVAESLEEQYIPQQNTSPEKCQLETTNFSVNEMVVESLKEQSPEKPQPETAKILVNGVVAESLEEQSTPQRNTSPEKPQLETTKFSVNEMVVESLKTQSPQIPQLETTKTLMNGAVAESFEEQSIPQLNTTPEKSELETTTFTMNGMIDESLEEQSTPQRNTSPEKPQLETTTFMVNEMIVKSLEEQSAEPNCVWSLKDFKHPQRDSTGSLSFAFKLLDSTVIVTFFLKSKDDSDSWAVVGSDLRLEDHQLRLQDYETVRDFGYEKFKKKFEEVRPRVETINRVSYLLDRMNLFLQNIRPYLDQVHTILRLDPGSKLEKSTLMFHLYSWPLHFSCHVSVDLSEFFELSESSLSFHFNCGETDTNRITEIFLESLSLENALCEFVVRSTRYVIELERPTGIITKRWHVKLLQWGKEA